jgi:hypothetical protein
MNFCLIERIKIMGSRIIGKDTFATLQTFAKV